MVCSSGYINHFSCGCDRTLGNFREEKFGLVHCIISISHHRQESMVVGGTTCLWRWVVRKADHITVSKEAERMVWS